MIQLYVGASAKRERPKLIVIVNYRFTITKLDKTINNGSTTRTRIICT